LIVVINNLTFNYSTVGQEGSCAVTYAVKILNSVYGEYVGLPSITYTVVAVRVAMFYACLMALSAIYKKF
jgi:hypothetical protein